ncbi:MAG TPA: hypothetical protein VL403_04600 [Candidatus Kryptonia bacterium]|nr:hypothetical protein [Candidatus Kryptonia bacterium]
MNATDVTPEQLAEIVEQISRGADTYPVPADLLHEHDPGVLPVTPVADPAAENEPPVNKSLYNTIMQMAVGQKIKLALKGNRDARNILIRDSNRLIPRFVLQNPRITEDEIAAMSRNRNIDTDLLRIIGDHKEWSRLQPVRSALVNNPKTPVTIALRFVGSLPDRELRLLAKSKNVQSAVAGKAKRLVMQRQTPNAGHAE